MTRPDANADATASGRTPGARGSSGAPDFILGCTLFRRASLLLYASLLLLPGSAALAAHEDDMPWAVVAALLGLALLSAHAGWRIAERRITGVDQTWLAVEMGIFLACLAALTIQSPELLETAPWIIAAAAI